MCVRELSHRDEMMSSNVLCASQVKSSRRCVVFERIVVHESRVSEACT